MTSSTLVPRTPTPRTARAVGIGACCAVLGAALALLVGPVPVLDELRRAAALVTTGTLLVAVCCVPSPGERLTPTADRLVAAAAAPACAWVLLSGADVAVRLHDVTGLSPLAVLLRLLDGPGGWWWSSPAVRPSLLATVVTVGVAAALLTRRARAGRAGTASGHAAAGAVLLAALLTVLPGTVTGHALHGGHPRLAALALTVHVLAVTGWVGGLAALVVHRERLGASLPVAASRFSAGAAVAVVLLVLSGTAFALLTVPDLAALPGSRWAVLLLAKVALLVPVCALGARHRRRTLPALRRGDRRAFVRFALAELALLALALVLATALATTPEP